MATTSSPIEVGTRGTIGFLVSQEIEYFKKVDLDRRESSHKPKIQTVEAMGASTSGSSRPKLGFSGPASKKKAKGSGGFIPSICSVVEIADNSRTGTIAGVGYRNLRIDEKKSNQH